MKIKINKPELLYFISDTHFGHKNVIKFNNRPFDDIQQHDNMLVDYWNSVVPKDGIVFHQGDFALKLRSNKLKWILESLNGKIYLCLGNHERDIIKRKWSKDYFIDIQNRYEIEIYNGLKIENIIIADHFPLYSWWRKEMGSIHTYGHMHSHLSGIVNSYNVGVDFNNYKPISYYNLIKKIKKD